MIMLFWIFLVIGVALVGLVMLPRNRYYTWGWNVLIVLAVAYFGLYKLTGSPRSVCMLSTLGGLSGDYEIVFHSEVPHKSIFLLIEVEDEPLLLETRWTKGQELAIRRAAMEAQRQGGVLMVRADALSYCGDASKEKDDRQRDDGLQNQALGGKDGKNAPKRGTEGGDPTFYPKPVPADPLKTPPPGAIINVH